MSPSAARPTGRRSWVILSLAGALGIAIALAALLPERASVADASAVGPEVPPKVIRFGGPGASKQNQKMWGLLEVARSKGFLAREFADDDVKLEYVGFLTVPMVGEALASNAIDFAGQGELIALLSRSAGTDTRMILPVSRLENAYLVVPVNSPIHRIEDIRGRRIAYARGAYIHIQTLRILADHAMSERDIQPVNLDPASSTTVLASGGIDGAFLGLTLALPLRDNGIARIVYDTKAAPTETAQTGLIVRQSFIDKYPRTTQRVVSALVRAARWAADPVNRDEVTELWVYGTDRSVKDLREDLGPGLLTARTSPLIDSFAISQYRNTQKFAIGAQLLRQPVDLDRWLEPRFVNRALNEEKLVNYWPNLDASGRASDGAVRRMAGVQ